MCWFVCWSFLPKLAATAKPKTPSDQISPSCLFYRLRAFLTYPISPNSVPYIGIEPSFLFSPPFATTITTIPTDRVLTHLPPPQLLASCSPAGPAALSLCFPASAAYLWEQPPCAFLKGTQIPLFNLFYTEKKEDPDSLTSTHLHTAQTYIQSTKRLHIQYTQSLDEERQTALATARL